MQRYRCWFAVGKQYVVVEDAGQPVTFKKYVYCKSLKKNCDAVRLWYLTSSNNLLINKFEIPYRVIPAANALLRARTRFDAAEEDSTEEAQASKALNTAQTAATKALANTNRIASR